MKKNLVWLLAAALCGFFACECREEVNYHVGEPERNWAAYSNGQTVEFQSDRGAKMSFKVIFDDQRFLSSGGFATYMTECPRVFDWNRSIRLESDDSIQANFGMGASRPGDTTAQWIFFRIDRFWGGVQFSVRQLDWSRTNRSVFRLPQLVVSNRSLTDVSRFDEFTAGRTLDSAQVDYFVFTKVYLSQSQGLVRLDERDGEVWERVWP